MNEEKAKILLRLYKQDLITSDEFLILCKETYYVPNTAPNWTPAQPYINTPYYTSGTGLNSAKSTTDQHSSTIGSNFFKKWINSEEPKFDS